MEDVRIVITVFVILVGARALEVEIAAPFELAGERTELRDSIDEIQHLGVGDAVSDIARRPVIRVVVGDLPIDGYCLTSVLLGVASKHLYRAHGTSNSANGTFNSESEPSVTLNLLTTIPFGTDFTLPRKCGI